MSFYSINESSPCRTKNSGTANQNIRWTPRPSLITFGLILVFGFASAFGQPAPQLAVKGMQYYESGQYLLAEKYFKRSLEDARLKGHKEWEAAALLNLMHLDVERRDAGKLRLHLAAYPDFPEKSKWTMYGIWKRAQLHVLEEKRDSARSALKVVQSLCKAHDACLLADWDRLDLEIRETAVSNGNYKRLQKKIEEWDKDAGKEYGAEVASLKGLLNLRFGKYGEAQTQWQSALNGYRSREQLSRMAQCFKYLALAQLKQGRAAEADASIQSAVNVYQRLDLPRPGFRVAFLRLFLLEDSEGIENYKKNLDLISQALGNPNWGTIIKEYKHLADLSPSPLLSSHFP